MPTITLTVTLSGPGAEEAADRVAQAISEIDSEIDSEIGPAAALSAPPLSLAPAKARRGGAGLTPVPSFPILQTKSALARSLGADIGGGGTVLIDTPSRQVYVNREPIRFTRREYDLLLFLTTHAGVAYTRLQLLRAVWGHEFSGERTVDVHVRRIRVKLRRSGSLLATVHGFGYRLENTDQIFVVQTR